MTAMTRAEAAETYPFVWRWPHQNDDGHGWQSASGEDSGPVEALEVIPLAEQTNRTLWAGEYGGDSFPVCKSDDGIVGTVLEPEAAEALRLPHVESGQRLCSECPAAARRGSDACRAQNVVWVLTRKHHNRPVRLRIPHWAAKGWREFLRRNGRGVLGTRVLSLFSKDWTAKFPKVAVDTVRDLDEAGIQVAAEVRDNHIWGMLALGVTFGPEPEEAPSPEADLLFGSAPSLAAPATTTSAAAGEQPHVE